MAIDRVSVNIYTCSKCQYKWLGGWDNENNKEYPVPSYCPKCKNFRWDWDHIPEEKELFDAVLSKHVSKNKNKREQTIFLDIIAVDFLYRIRPQPDMFELKHVLSVPTTEKRHESMLAIMENRANYDKYPVGYQGRAFPKYTKHKAYVPWIYKRGAEQVLMKDCKHGNRSRAVRQQLKERGFRLMTDSSNPA